MLPLIAPPKAIYWPDIIYAIKDALPSTEQVYLVGGAVRDAVRGYPLKDIDLACTGDGRRLARRLADAFRGDYYALDAERGVGRALVQYQDTTLAIDVAQLRGSLEDDLRDRDFTLNAMAVPLESDLSGIYDPLGGLDDLFNKHLRLCTPQAIAQDPVRALRAVRQSLAFGLAIQPESKAIIRRDGQGLGRVSAERIRDEFFALLAGPKPLGGLMILRTLGLLGPFLPDLQALPHEAYRRSLQALEKLHILLTVISPRRDDNVAANAEFGTFVYLLDRYRPLLQDLLAQPWPDGRQHHALLLFAMLMLSLQDDAETAAQYARQQAEALKLSSAEAKQIADAIRYSHLPHDFHQNAPLNEADRYRFWQQVGEFGLNSCLLGAALYLTQAGYTLSTPRWTAYLQTLESLLGAYEPIMRLQPIITGHDVMHALGVRPGPHLGDLLAAVRLAQYVGEVTTQEEALVFAEAWLSENAP